MTSASGTRASRRCRYTRRHKLARPGNALALEPVHFDRHPEHNPEADYCRSARHRSPRGRRATEAVLRTAGICRVRTTLYWDLPTRPPSVSSSNPPTVTASPFVDGRSQLPCSRNNAASLDKTTYSKPDSALRHFRLPLPMPPSSRRVAEVGSPPEAIPSAHQKRDAQSLPSCSGP